ncbi:MAG: apolipoprotein N-acyltransferase [Leptolyngbyaceae bacterium]|nr:apolipoprotein N-acyltransferase [Leptolyngbyaceae bacterium]
MLKQPYQTLTNLGIALVGGILMGLTPAPVNAWWLAWIALVPLWVLVINHPSRIKQCTLLGLAWGIGYHGLALSWITGVHPMTWMGVPWLASLAIALFCWLFITLWGAVLPALWAGIMVLAHVSLKRSQTPLRFQIGYRVLIGVGAWCGLEWLWGFGPLLWTSLSYTQSPYNLVILHLGQISGPTTVTAALIAVNGFMAEAWLHRDQSWQLNLGEKPYTLPLHRKSLGLAVGLFVSLHLIGLGLYLRPLNQTPDSAFKVGIIQGNVPNEIKLYPAGWRKAIEGYTTGYNTLAEQGVEAVLTPETALPFFWTEFQQHQSSFYQAILNQKVTAWVGALGSQGRSITNSLFTINGQGQVLSQYNKVKLVPLGEYIPFEDFLGRFIDRLSPLDAHMVAGQPRQTFDTPLGRAIVGICYESAFAEHFRYQTANGGEFILSPSNDAHYSDAMPAQHHAQDVMRAIESDRWTVRATNTGYSGIVDPHGRTQWLSQLHIYELHAATIYRRQTQTLYVRWGDWLTPLLAGLGFMVWIANFAVSRSQNRARLSSLD